MRRPPFHLPAARKWFLSLLLIGGQVSAAEAALPGSKIVPEQVVQTYADGRPAAKYRLDAKDAGVVLAHGGGPQGCDRLGARDVWGWEHGGTYFMHYDGAGSNAWLACLATSKDLTNWTTLGPVLQLGRMDEDDSASASYGVTHFEQGSWHMFYLGTRRVTQAPNFIPSTPYVTMKASGPAPTGPWSKQPDVVPFRCKPGTYYSDTASPGAIVKQGSEFRMFFSAATRVNGKLRRTLGISRTENLDQSWALDAQPIVPSTEQIENSSLHFEPESRTWFLFSNHIGYDGKSEFTDAIWVYWTRDLNSWSAADKAVVLDGRNCRWSQKCIGLPSVIQVGSRLAIFYDAPGDGSTSHMKRNIGLAWLDLPLRLPETASAPIQQ